MKRKSMKSIFACITFLSLSFSAQAGLEVTNAWVKSTAPGQPVAAAYMTLKASNDIKVIGASSSLAGSVEIHEMSMTNNVMKMRKLKDLALQSGKLVSLSPGGYHLMLQDIKHQIKSGELVPMALLIQDENGNNYKLSFEVEAKDAAPTDNDHNAHHH